MTLEQRRIGLGGAFVFGLLLIYPPWHVEYEGGASALTYSIIFSPPNDYRRLDGNRSVPPNGVSLATGTILGELAAVVVVTGFLLWLYRPITVLPPPTVS